MCPVPKQGRGNKLNKKMILSKNCTRAKWGRRSGRKREAHTHTHTPHTAHQLMQLGLYFLGDPLLAIELLLTLAWDAVVALGERFFVSGAAAVAAGASCMPSTSKNCMQKMHNSSRRYSCDGDGRRFDLRTLTPHFCRSSKMDL